jgi:hypothetical protein
MVQEVNRAESQFQFDDGSAVPRRATFLAWPVVFVAAIIIHHVTGSPIAAASVFAVHAGWKSFRCGLWLKAVDPVASRGRACLWFYMGAACWRAAGWAFVTGLIFVEAARLFGQPPPEKELMVELLIFAACVCLTSVLGLLAVASALRGMVRVWVNPSIRERCGGDFARLGDIAGLYIPQLGAYHGGINHAVFVVALSLVVPVAIAATAFLIWSTINQPRDQALTLQVLLTTFLPFMASLATIPVCIIISRKVVAKTPADCWPPRRPIPAESG